MTGLWEGSVANCCEEEDERSSSVKHGVFPVHLSNK